MVGACPSTNAVECSSAMSTHDEREREDVKGRERERLGEEKIETRETVEEGEELLRSLV